jgi:hypothetical protein
MRVLCNGINVIYRETVQQTVVFGRGVVGVADGGLERLAAALGTLKDGCDLSLR